VYRLANGGVAVRDQEPTEKKSLRSRIVSGSAVLLSGSTFAVAINLAYNITVAHYLGPKGFGDANALYTLLTLISAVTLSYQIIASKIVAQQENRSQRDGAYRDLQRAAWGSGLMVALLMVLFRTQITSYLDLPDPQLVTILALGAAFYIPLGARRGYTLGAFGFGKLATNLVLEGLVRFTGSLALAAAGFGVRGVILANAAAMAVSYFAIASPLEVAKDRPFHASLREVAHATVFFAGQVLINNCDIVLVKHFFAPADAGLYAAIAMVGRVTFSGSQAVVNGMFPVVAGSKREERKSFALIGTALLLVLLMGVAMASILSVMPSAVWTTLFGKSFQIAGPHGFSYLLALYAIATTFYCLAVVVMTYEMSYKIANTNYYQLLFSGILIAGLYFYHGSLEQVIVTQLVLLGLFFAVITTLFIYGFFNDANGEEARSIRMVRRVSQDEIVSEFLKSDFHHPAYSRYHESHRAFVHQPDLEDEAACEVRRLLLESRHYSLLRELPADTEWFEVEITREDLPQIRVFPRAQWTRIARGNYSIQRVAECIRKRQATEDPFVEKISEIREELSEDVFNSGAVILIGLSESSPLTVLDGNHRFVAGVLENKLENLRFVCGLSPNMKQCCWYKTNLSNLVRYGRHRARRFFHSQGEEQLALCSTTVSNLNGCASSGAIGTLQ
jgi:O-antigen/teichoic acid export membrane protein